MRGEKEILAISRDGWFAILGGKERLLMHFRAPVIKKRQCDLVGTVSCL